MKIEMIHSAPWVKPLLGTNGKPLMKKIKWREVEMEVPATETVYLHDGIVEVPDELGKTLIRTGAAKPVGKAVEEEPEASSDADIDPLS